MFVNCLDVAIIYFSQVPRGVARFRLLQRRVLSKLQGLGRLGRLPLAPHMNLCLFLLDSHALFLQAGRPQSHPTTTLFSHQAEKAAGHPVLDFLIFDVILRVWEPVA